MGEKGLREEGGVDKGRGLMWGRRAGDKREGWGR